MTALAHDFGALRVVTPAEQFRLPRLGWLDLNLAIVAAEDGNSCGARQLIRRLEDRLGVTERDRYVATLGEAPEPSAVRAYAPAIAANSARQRAVWAEQDRARDLTVEDDAGLTADNLKAVEQAEALREQASEAKGRDAKPLLAQAKTLQRQAAQDRAFRTQRNYEARIAAERKQRAQEHGEEIVTETVEMSVLVPMPGVMEGAFVHRQQRITRIRNTSRDGLESLLRSGTLNQVQWSVGMKYRRDFEMLQDGLGSQFGGFEGGRGVTLPVDLEARPEVPRGLSERARQRDRFASIERRIKAKCSAPDLSIYALRRIAGAGDSLTELAMEPRRRAAIRAALVEALDVFGDILGIH